MSFSLWEWRTRPRVNNHKPELILLNFRRADLCIVCGGDGVAILVGDDAGLLFDPFFRWSSWHDGQENFSPAFITDWTMSLIYGLFSGLLSIMETAILKSGWRSAERLRLFCVMAQSQRRSILFENMISVSWFSWSGRSCLTRQLSNSK